MDGGRAAHRAGGERGRPRLSLPIDTSTHVWIDDDRGFATVVRELESAEAYALDTEFHRERTYHARLALLQLAWPGGNAVVDPTVVLPDDWRTLPEGTAAVDTFAYEARATGLEVTSGELPYGTFSRANFEVSADGIVEPLSLMLTYTVVDCTPTPTPRRAPANAVAPTPPQTDTTAESRATPATGPMVGVLIALVGIVGASAVAARRPRRR